MNGRADVAAVNLRTGEALERLDEQPPETLAEALDVVHARQAELKAWQDALEGELRRRLKLRQTKLAIFGDWEVEATTGRESVWDADGLEAALRQLVDDGVVRAGDVADVITRDPVVARSRARDLLNRLTGEAHDAVEACRTWKEKPGKLTVARSVALPAPASDTTGREPALEPTSTPAPPDRSTDGAGPPTVTVFDPVPAPSASVPPPPAPADLNPEELFA